MAILAVLSPLWMPSKKCGRTSSAQAISSCHFPRPCLLTPASCATAAREQQYLSQGPHVISQPRRHRGCPRLPAFGGAGAVRRFGVGQWQA